MPDHLPHPPPGSPPRPPAPAFRRPLPPAPIERFDISHPAVPAPLRALTILHLSDLHIRRWASPGRAPGGHWRTLLSAVESVQVDLVALTGDFMDQPGGGQEDAAARALSDLSRAWNSRLGAVGVMGNHDSPAFARLARRVESIDWIGGRSRDFSFGPHLSPSPAPAVLRVLGLDWPEDALTIDPALLASDPGDPPVFTLTLAHLPTAIFPCAEIGLPLVLAGHTHAGQIRVSPRLAPHTSSDIPVHLAAGVLRLRDTLCCVSRGLGDGVVEGLRINCPRQAPVYTLRPGPPPGERSQTVTQVVAW